MHPTQEPDRQLTRRAILRLFGSAAGTALLAACQPPPPSTSAAKPTAAAAASQPQPTSAAAATSVSGAASDRPAQAGFQAVGVGPSAAAALTASRGQPHSGGTLRIGNLGDLPNADGHWISGQNIIYPVYDRLVDLDASLQPHPSLAESWNANPDFTQIIFKVRKGVMWHSGRELSAEDIAWNYNRIKSDRKIDGGIKANFFVPLDSIETTDRYTLVLKANQPWPAVFNVLAWTNILDPQVTPEQNKPAGPVRSRSLSGSRVTISHSRGMRITGKLANRISTALKSKSSVTHSRWCRNSRAAALMWRFSR